MIREGIEPATMPVFLCPFQIEGRMIVLGRIAKFFENKGYGFIVYECEGTKEEREAFFHFRDTNRPSNRIYIDDRCEFELMDGPKGLKAIKVQIQE